MGDGFHWVTIVHPEPPELEVTLMVSGRPPDPEMTEAVERSLAKRTMGERFGRFGHASRAVLRAFGMTEGAGQGGTVGGDEAER